MRAFRGIPFLFQGKPNSESYNFMGVPDLHSAHAKDGLLISIKKDPNRFKKIVPISVIIKDLSALNTPDNEAPRRKRTGYQSGLKSNLYFGGTRSFPPNPSSACLPHRKRMGYFKDYNNMVQGT